MQTANRMWIEPVGVCASLQCTQQSTASTFLFQFQRCCWHSELALSTLQKTVFLWASCLSVKLAHHYWMLIFSFTSGWLCCSFRKGQWRFPFKKSPAHEKWDVRDNSSSLAWSLISQFSVYLNLFVPHGTILSCEPSRVVWTQVYHLLYGLLRTWSSSQGTPTGLKLSLQATALDSMENWYPFNLTVCMESDWNLLR